ncbi:MAG: methylated-DNA--[protein]-cysteine S-methyltransferase [Muribaculaceae bacterium]|nr:methylated-DNA--[protein]-cysteine S-methyltransferase [Muribaculaceae bacterium]
MNISKDNILEHLSHPAFRIVGEVADEMNRECYVVGGYVRDIFLERKSKDIDFVTVGSGIEVAKLVAQKFGRNKAHLSVFKTYGTAQVKAMGMELEFVGARRESYNRNSRNPIVEDGTLDDDQRRRDFTINAMAISINHDSWGNLLDPFDGIGDIERRLIRTPLNPDITFSDDPLRMMRAVRFATQLGFEIEEGTFAAIKRNADRIKIITRERIADELMKIMRSPVPSRGFFLLDKSGLLPLICPELAQLKGVDTVNGRGHKDNFLHTMQVLDNVAAASDNEWLRWAALFHDIGKPTTKHWDEKMGWTFHNHNFIGEKMVPRIFAKMRLPLNEHMKYVKKLVGLHMRPIALVEEEVTDSAVRRMLFEAGDDIDDLMTLCRADITSKNQEKVKRFRENYELVKQKIIDIEEKDRVRNFQPPVDGQEIMDTFGLAPSRPVGLIKDAIKDAILDGVIRNDYAEAYQFMMNKAQELEIKPITEGKLNCVVIDSPMGKLTIAASSLGITAIEFGETDLSALAAKMKLELCHATTPLLENCVMQLNEYFDGNRRDFSLPLYLTGTDFQLKVWDTLRSIPYGTTVSYKEEAIKMGDEKATRAVAQANGANPIPIIIPCHRVINSDGTIGGYSGGVDKKLFLLNLERTVCKTPTSD